MTRTPRPCFAKAQAFDDASACSPSKSTAENQTGIAAETVATQAGGVYVDSNHLTPEYARALAPAMGTLADRALAQG